MGEIFLRRHLTVTSPPLSAERENPQMIAAVARSARLLRQGDLVRALKISHFKFAIECALHKIQNKYL
jgi:hypothetical protein